MVLPGGSGDAVWAGPLGRGLRCEGDFQGASGCWRLAPLSLTGCAPWKPLLLRPQVLLLHAGPRPPCQPWCPSVTGLPREPSAGPSRPDCLDCTPRWGTRFLSGKLLQASPPRLGTPGPLGSWNEVLPHLPPGPNPQRPAGSPSKPGSRSLEPLRLPPPPRPVCEDALAPPSGQGFPGGLVVTNPLAEDTGSVPGSERCPGGGNGYPLQYSCLENPVDRGAWRATARGVSSQTRLSTHAHPV